LFDRIKLSGKEIDMGILVTEMHQEVPLTKESLPVGQRVVLTTSHNLSFAGTLQAPLSMYEEDGTPVMLDEKTRFTIWCPLEHVQRLLVVPIAEENEQANALPASQDPMVTEP
jgi:hypothetical protein